jgi:hypothetical protein
MEQKTGILRQPKDRQKLFQVTAKEDDKLGVIIDLDYEMQNISKPTLQEFMLFAIDCARERLKLVYAQQRR